eukprot:TRINITY_DN2190_c0_g1_i1.p1 TRINITY_DN2190_c0_g1~~TRINITY_DN2190_c0_g1_i1.p1  ORF type:complete len:838 (-),score=311.05 TRINITY_DN2190_c0_g1_i1:299-2812(-)
MSLNSFPIGPDSIPSNNSYLDLSDPRYFDNHHLQEALSIKGLFGGHDMGLENMGMFGNSFDEPNSTLSPENYSSPPSSGQENSFHSPGSGGGNSSYHINFNPSNVSLYPPHPHANNNNVSSPYNHLNGTPLSNSSDGFIPKFYTGFSAQHGGRNPPATFNLPSHQYNRRDSLITTKSDDSYEDEQNNMEMFQTDSKEGILNVGNGISNAANNAVRKRRRKEEGGDESELPFTFLPYHLLTHHFWPLLDSNGTNATPSLSLEIRSDKNVHFSEPDDCWLHYKQNHFQITVNIKTPGDQPPNRFQLDMGGGIGYQPVEEFYIEVSAVKSTDRRAPDAEETKAELNQTGKLRTKEDNHALIPFLVQDGNCVISRLRFQNSTAHNARTKNNETNPNQQYFRLVITLLAESKKKMYPIIKYISGPLIVRGQNPGRYAYGKPGKGKENSQEVTPPPPPPVSNPSTSTMNSSSILSQPSAARRPSLTQSQPQISANQFQYPRENISFPSMDFTQNNHPNEDTTTTFNGRVGINTNHPRDALDVHGNIMVTGTVLKPSDQRIKENLSRVSPADSLKNISNLRVYDYDLKKWKEAGSHRHRERGVLAQDVQRVLPQAVETVGDVELGNGQVIQNLLVVNERVLLFENIGATQELKSLLENEMGYSDQLGTRVGKMEYKGDAMENRVQAEKNRLDGVVDYIMSEEARVDNGFACCFCSMFGLGPAWTMWVLGWIFPPFWLAGIPYIASWTNSTRRKAGIACLVSMIIFILYWTMFLLLKDQAPLSPLWGFEVELVIGIVVIVIITVYLTKRNQKIIQQRYKRKQFVLRPKLYAYEKNPKKDDVTLDV